MKNVASVNYDDCIACTTCTMNCPTGAVFMTDEGHAEVKYSECIDCGACIEICPVSAIIENEVDL